MADAMIALALLFAQAASAPPVADAIGQQVLPATGCAAYLWRTGPTPALIAMASATSLRVSVDGKRADLPRTAARGEAVLGLPAGADFAGEGLVATLDLAVAAGGDVIDGARVPAGTLTLMRSGGDAAVIPVAGLVGCATAKR
jgi:hypothetical protein